MSADELCISRIPGGLCYLLRYWCGMPLCWFTHDQWPLFIPLFGPPEKSSHYFRPKINTQCFNFHLYVRKRRKLWSQKLERIPLWIVLWGVWQADIVFHFLNSNIKRKRERTDNEADSISLLFNHFWDKNRHKINISSSVVPKRFTCN